MGKKYPRKPPPNVEFQESRYDDLFMQEIFNSSVDIPDKDFLNTSIQFNSGKSSPSPNTSKNISPDDYLDLHGKTQEESIRMVQNFVKTASRQRLKSVLIITGKGKHSQEGPVIKLAVQTWLQRNGKPYIRNFAYAPKKHGGDGAILVNLK